ncbi:MAG TPA: hypothetical protein VMJ64_07355, partial [Anaerolineales bacterium]|nr:hypothetical protein [Anaerolineales bacterium]
MAGPNLTTTGRGRGDLLPIGSAAAVPPIQAGTTGMGLLQHGADPRLESLQLAVRANSAFGKPNERLTVAENGGGIRDARR